MLFSPAIVEIGFGALAVLPYLKHGLDLFMYRKQPLEYPSGTFDGSLTVLLPVWNETVVIGHKLDNVRETCSDMEVHVVVIDSASTDDTVEQVRQWNNKNDAVFSSFTLLEMEERKGKTTAVQKALEHINNTTPTDLVLMSDADALFEPTTVSRILGWFNDPSIGCVGATPKRIGERTEEKEHRGLFSTVRVLESQMDSTPFLEGSCMVWRRAVLDTQALHCTSNADDAQIATNIRINGYRSIQDSQAFFIDHAPAERSEHARQKVRRAQGLQRHLLRQRKYWFSRRHGRFARILRQESALHILTPLFLFAGMVAMIARWLVIGLSEVDFENTTLTTMHVSLFVVETICILSLLLTRTGIRIIGISTIGTILDNNVHLLKAMWTSSRGSSLHLWDQHLDGRGN